MGGLGFGSWMASKSLDTSSKVVWIFGTLVGLWAMAFPVLLSVLTPTITGDTSWRIILAIPLLLPPALAHGATLPVLSTITKQANNTAWLYSLNTFGAVIGVLGSAFVLLPTIGVRNTELFGMIPCIAVCFASLMYRYQIPPQRNNHCPVPMKTLLLMGVVGFASMSLEIVWSRLGALRIGGSVYAFAVVRRVSDRNHGFCSGKEAGQITSSNRYHSNGCFDNPRLLFLRWLPHGLALDGIGLVMTVCCSSEHA